MSTTHSTLVSRLFVAALASLCRRFACLDESPLIATYWVEVGDWDNVSHRQSTRRIDILTLHQIVAERYDVRTRTKQGIRDMYATRTLNQLKVFIAGCYEGLDDVRGFHIETQEENVARLLEERREKLETAAADFARTNDVRPGTFDFVAKLVDTIDVARQSHEAYNSGEARAEEWAAHNYAGCTGEYYNNRDYTNGIHAERIETLEDILAWLDEACPLLMASYREQQLATTSK